MFRKSTIFFFSFLVFSLLIPLQSRADEAKHGASLDQVLETILVSQSVTQIEEIDCEPVSEDQFEELGEAFMGIMHPDTEEHERMDAMMGGEGSERLRNAHINMGSRYLGCTTDRTEMRGMMGAGSGMMGFTTDTTDNWTDWITRLLLWATLVLAIVSLMTWLNRQKKG